MSGLEVLAVVGCVAAVVSAFHGAAELTDIIKDSKERRRKRREKPAPSIPPDLLRQSFVDGAQQVDNSSIERRQRFGVEFERGDQMAKLELMQVVINLQGEVIRALQLARDVSYDVNMTTIYEYSITNRRDAINSMDHLCQRIMQNQGPLRTLSITAPTRQQGNPLSSVETLDSSMGSMHLDELQRRISHDSLAPFSQSPASDLPAAITIQRSPKDSLSTATRSWSALPSSSIQRGSSNASVARSLHWLGRHIRKDDTDAMTVRTPRIQEVPESEMLHPDRPDVRASSLPYTTSMGSEANWRPGTLEPPNIAVNTMSSRSVSTSGYPPVQQFATPQTADSSDSDFTLRPGFDTSKPSDSRMPSRSCSATAYMPNSPWTGGSRDSVPSLGERTSSVSSASSRNLTPSTDSTRSLVLDGGIVRPDSYPRWTAGAIRPDHDPSYRQDEYKSELSQSPTADNSAWAAPNLSLANTLNQYPSVLKSEPLDPWVPHEKPSKANRFHGFCEGAWLTREKATTGLQVTLKPYGMTAVLPYWQCRKCQLCIRATSAKDTAPPSYIYTSAATGIKYRWIFLARSHFKSKDTSGAGHEAATFGCIFCVAEGNKDTLAYGKIDLLMAHIRNYHGGDGMAPEVKGRTRCITGRVAKAEEEWDINIPPERRQS